MLIFYSQPLRVHRLHVEALRARGSVLCVWGRALPSAKDAAAAPTAAPTPRGAAATANNTFPVALAATSGPASAADAAVPGRTSTHTAALAPARAAHASATVHAHADPAAAIDASGAVRRPAGSSDHLPAHVQREQMGAPRGGAAGVSLVLGEPLHVHYVPLGLRHAGAALLRMRRRKAQPASICSTLSWASQHARGSSCAADAAAAASPHPPVSIATAAPCSARAATIATSEADAHLAALEPAVKAAISCIGRFSAPAATALASLVAVSTPAPLAVPAAALAAAGPAAAAAAAALLAKGICALCGLRHPDQQHHQLHEHVRAHLDPRGRLRQWRRGSGRQHLVGHFSRANLDRLDRR